MGRRGHRRNTGDGTRSRRTDLEFAGLSGDPLPLTLPVEGIQVERAVPCQAKFHIRSRGLVRCGTNRRRPAPCLLPMARGTPEAAWSGRVVLMRAKESD